MPSLLSSNPRVWFYQFFVKTTWAYWFCQFGGWGALWLLNIEIEENTNPIQYLIRNLGKNALFYGSAILLTHLWRGLILLRGWKSLSLLALLPRILIGSIILTLIHIVTNDASTILKSYTLPLLDMAAVIGILILLGFVQFAAWTGIYLGYQMQKQLGTLKITLLEQQVMSRSSTLQALQSQLNPHFFFNSLNTLRYMIEKDPAKAREMVTQLTQVFRTSLQQDQKLLVTLKEEWKTVAAYLAIESLRFESRLEIRIQIDPLTLDKLVPPFLIQTLIENAIKFGIAPNEEGGYIEFNAHLRESNLWLEISNQGSLAPIKTSSTGVGIMNTKERLRMLFNNEASLELVDGNNKVTVIVKIPVTNYL
jgi:two-component system, LytTR family, sensor kinase